VSTSERASAALGEPSVRAEANAARRRRQALLGGGTDGNELLTNITGIVLLPLLAIIGLTILRMRQLISVHLFVGLLLLGPVALKMGSTGYRFIRYYARNPVYRKKGPPEPILRMIAPVVVITTVVVFISGLLLLFGGPSSKDSWLELHKVSFIVWAVFTAIHVLAHLPSIARTLRIGTRNVSVPGVSAGAAGRWIVLAGALVGGLVIAIVLIPDFASWTANSAFHHHHHHD
jgi:hypothetical protein